ncbi:AAA-domain-containing protein [Ceraceosorus guamensis]|uniref:Peroxisomal ATPase PEX6 n=1 Tax=Ceraceosorus guamensis TaxID=1522189 RepID=A0A316VZT5_9BASI|nr:AAA-domain-containing protein [Ceraceosorus guamensis]PWN43106.1 AAA-domain-containing protein [Ceraceosorus guamensis]
MPTRTDEAEAAGKSVWTAELRVHSHTGSVLVSKRLYDLLRAAGLDEPRKRDASKEDAQPGDHAAVNGHQAERESQQALKAVAASVSFHEGSSAFDLRSLVVLAERAIEGDEESAEDLAISIPESLAVQHLSSISTTSHVLVQSTSAIILSRVLLCISDDQTFETASQSSQLLHDALHGSIARQGETLHVQVEGGGALALNVVMAEPVLQGAIFTRFTTTQDERRSTELLLTYDQDSRHTSGGSAKNEQASQRPVATDQSRLYQQSRPQEDHLLIDERFLANSVLDDFDSDDEFGDGSDAAPAGRANGIDRRLRGAPAEGEPGASSSLFASSSRLQPLIQHDRSTTLQAISSWRERLPEDERGEDVDEELAVLLDEQTLASVGAFDGDWAVAELEGQGVTRIARLFASPRPIPPPPVADPDEASTSTATTLGALALLPPMFLQNLHRPAHFDPARLASRVLLLRPCPSPPRSSLRDSKTHNMPLSCPLPLPFADALTISRIAGPLSINRAYQPIFLDALRRYFEGRSRVVRLGDIIAVGIDEGRVRWVNTKTKTSDEAEDKGPEGDQEDDKAPDFDLPTITEPAEDTAIVYFRIASLTPELFRPPGADAASINEAEASIRLAAQNGEIGCVVEPTLSKMIQTGVDKSRVADAYGWLSINSRVPPPPLHNAALQSAKSAYRQLTDLVQATLSPRTTSYDLHLSAIIKGARGTGKRTLAHWVARGTGVPLLELSCYELVADTDARTEGMLRARFEQAASCGPAILLLRNVEALARKSQAMESGQEPAMVGALRDCMEQLKRSTSSTRGTPTWPVSVFATTSEPEKCPTGVLACFKHEVEISAPSEDERLSILQSTLQKSVLGPDASLQSIATQTAALVAADLVDLAERAREAAVQRAIGTPTWHAAKAADRDIVLAGLALNGADFEAALSKARANYSESIGAPKIPNVTWDDVGGLASVKDDILDTIQLPLDHPELFSDGLKKRSGILLYGPPGTGKTLLAKAVATSCSLNFFSVKGPELLNMYIGESEANVRRVFQRARDAKPCVIFFDELDSVAPKRGNQGDSGGVMDRIVSQLLAELDGMSGSSEGSDVFVIGATNRPDLLDPALLRPGRFDRLLYLSVSETHAAQLNILQALTRKFKLDAELSLGDIAEQCPFNLTGADFYALCSDAMLKAMTRKASEVDGKIAELNAQPPPYDFPHPMTPQYYLAERASASDVEVRVSRVDFEAALRELSPSVSEAEMAHYREVQAKFSKPPEERDAEEKQHAGLPAPNGKASGRTDDDLVRALRQLGVDASNEHGELAPPMQNGSNGHQAHPNEGSATGSVAIETAGEQQNDFKSGDAMGHAAPRKTTKGKGKARAE